MSSKSRARLRLKLLIMGVLVLVAGANSAVATPVAPDSVMQTPPFYCEWIPDPWKPPECQPTAPPGSGSDEVENRFAAAGPSTVTREAAGGYTLFTPADLTTDGVDNPILVWGNGTGATPDDYVDTLSHLASWGFVVVATNSGGFHDQMRAAGEYIVAQDRNPSSRFSGQLDTANVGVFGHSQGAGATLTIMATSLNGDGLFRSAMPVNLPDRLFWGPGPTPNYNLVTQPMFFVTGASDFLTSAGEQTFFFNQVPGPAAKAAVVGGDHNVIQRTDNAMQGYVTAWFKYTLQGDQFARRAFVGDPPQISADGQWTNQAQKGLP